MHSIDKLQSAMIAPLSKYGLIQVSGDDAISFIHGQLSQDILHLKMDEMRFAGYCTAEGFLFATLFVWKSNQNVYLMVPKTILPSLLKRLQIYILRSKVTLTDISDTYSVFGLAGKKTEIALQSLFEEIPEKLFEKKEYGKDQIIRVRDAFDVPRFLWITSQKSILGLQKWLQKGNETDWELTEIDAGMPEIDSATQNRFLPQDINMDKIDGISFTKGCYPGQEKIAKYRNKPSQRMIRVYAKIPENMPFLDKKMSSDTLVFETGNPNPCGLLFRIAFRDQNCIDCLLIVSHNAIASQSLRLGMPDGLVLHKKALPYSLLDE